MRTTLDLPEKLLKDAMEAAHVKTKIADLKNFKGKVDLNIDMDVVRDR